MDFLFWRKYFSGQREKIDYIINLFKNEKTDFCEIVATVFAVWKENQADNVLVDDALLLKGFYAWSKEKQRFKETDVISALGWMKEKDIVPVNH